MFLVKHCMNLCVVAFKWTPDTFEEMDLEWLAHWAELAYQSLPMDKAPKAEDELTDGGTRFIDGVPPDG